MTRTRSAGTTIAVTLALVAPLMAGGILAYRAASQSPLESASEVEPLIGAVESAERFQEAQVAIAVEYADALSPATNASGTLTQFNAAPGAEVTTGDVLGKVNDQDLVAYASAAPLFRDIARGEEGPDIATAQQLLNDLGFAAGTADGKAGTGTEAAIKRFNAAHGYGVKNPVLSLAALVWVGTAPVTVAETSVALGDTVSPGTALFTTTASLAAITVTETPNVPRDADVELTVSGVTTPYEPGSGRVTDPDAVAAIALALGTATEGVGTVRLVTPVQVGTVPASAVVSDPQGRVCIFASPTSAPTPITPLGGTLGTVDLDPSLAGEAVLLNPRDVREDLACG